MLQQEKQDEHSEDDKGGNQQVIDPKTQVETNADVDSDDGRAYVVQYTKKASFPFEVGETVWIMKPGYRAPVGEFRIEKAHANDQFKLINLSTGAAHPELVEGKYLRRDPYAAGA